jgi:hypothetical protein
MIIRLTPIISVGTLPSPAQQRVSGAITKRFRKSNAPACKGSKSKFVVSCPNKAATRHSATRNSIYFPFQKMVRMPRRGIRRKTDHPILHF